MVAMNKNEEPKKNETPSESGQAEDSVKRIAELEAKIAELEEKQIDPEDSAKRIAELTEKLEAALATIEKLSGELTEKIEADAPKPVEEDARVVFMKKYPKEKYMVLHEIKYGDPKGKKVGNKIVPDLFKPGEPFSKSHPFFGEALKKELIAEVNPNA
jgi:hypothetical protein